MFQSLQATLLLFFYVLTSVKEAAAAALNSSTPSTKAFAKANASTSIIPSSVTSFTGINSCLPCLVAAFDLGGKGEILSQVFWYNSTISLPLDTVSVFVSEYSNTTVTSSSTILGNITSLSASISQQVILAEEDSHALADGFYGGFAPYVLANGTGGVLSGGVTSFAYPTPYVAVAGFSVFTNLPSAGCALDPTQLALDLITGGPDNLPRGVGVSTVQLISTFYSPLPVSAASEFFGFFNLDTKSFSAFLASNATLLSSIPYLKSCSYLTTGIGPPALLLPATALTSTVTTTVKEPNSHPTKSPAPGNPLKPPVIPQTTTPPRETNQGPPVQNSPAQAYQTQTTLKSGPSGQNFPIQGSPNKGASDQDSPVSDHNAPTPEPPSPEPSSSDLPEAVSHTISEPVPAISYAGTIIKPNEASQYNLPGIGKVNPGGPGVTTNGIIYSLAPLATAIISNGITTPITPIVDVAASPQPGVLSFKGSPYTADESSRFVIAGQTVTPAITISGTPIAIASGATAAIIGIKTIPIIHNPTVNTPAVAPILSLAGSTYTAGASSIFVIEGQTLAPGGNIEVQGTHISYPLGNRNVVIGTSTQLLSFPTITPPVTSPVLTYHGTAYTADSSSHFIIDGQTLEPGNVITVSGTPISYAAAQSAVVVGTDTRPLSFATITPNVITFDGSTYTADFSSRFTIDGQTLIPDGVITVSGLPISYAAAGTAVAIGSSTELLSFARPSHQAAVITFGGSTYTADLSSDFIISGQTLAPGDVITISGTSISYASGGTAVVIGTSTEPVSYATTSPSAAVVTFDGKSYTADASSDFVINGQTLTLGGIITVSGTPISYASDGADVVVGTSTEAVGIGGLIMSGLGAGPSSTSGTVVFTGGTLEGQRFSSWLFGAAVALSFGAAFLQDFGI